MTKIPSREEMEAALAQRVGEPLQRRLAQSTVAVCGLGGLGSHIACCLARAGVGRLILVDFDRVDVSNLNRQQYTARQVGMAKPEALRKILLEIAPYTKISAYTLRLTAERVPELLAPANVICEAFDRPEEKSMLVNAVLETLPEAHLVAASGMAGLGPAGAIHTRRITNHFTLCGDEVSDVEQGIGLVASRVMLCAAHQAHAVLRILAGQEEE